jgi:hypothetical protein
MPTTPYPFAGMTVVLTGKAKVRRIATLADLDGLDVAVEAGTLSDAILMTFERGRFVSQISHAVPGRGELFPRLEAREADATLILVHHFDVYLIEHPDTKLAPSGYFLPVGFNTGFVGLASCCCAAAVLGAAETGLGRKRAKTQFPLVTWQPHARPPRARCDLSLRAAFA